MVTGTSVLGVKFDGGIIIAADTLGSYGSLARFRDCPRVMKVNECSVLGAGGDYADYQHLKAMIEQKVLDEDNLNDGFNYTPKSLFNWLTRIMYHKRSNFNPLWNTLVIGGLQDGEPYLGYIDKLGVAYTNDTVATGFGSYLAAPMLRDGLEKNPKMTEADAKQLIDRALRVLFYRDARSWNRYQLAIVTKDGVRIEGPLSSKTDWSVAHVAKGIQ
ncbi:hypothetical protein CAPTEDRAFT_178772 [Capitella teleta]|uniref:Proteasome subunit beta n=1 Tax=Capitella teleta TaxID=283909 RepID=R7TWY6_CAPTE|nr:hypothetical protein CAPTEDRAFT_178772 [Capitella teleta]|eukprot:ELT98117.1 hypothetical protein CAPTEDRAFT_178772 [Capitella teleta]